MSELAVPFVYANKYADPDVMNQSWRRTTQQLADMMRRLLFADTTPDEDYGYVVGGLEPSATGDVETTVTAGCAVSYDSTIDPDPAADGHSPFALLVSEDALVWTHAARHATLARIDVIVLQFTTAVTDDEDIASVGGSPSATPTIRRGVFSLYAVDGTPDASPAAPTYPTGMVVLCEADVPATGGGAITYRTSVAQRANTAYTRRDPIVFQQDDAYAAANATPPLLAVRKVGRGLDGVGVPSFQSWDWATDWPVFVRGVADAGEASSPTKMFPLMAPGGRTWWRTYPFLIGWEAPEFGSKFTAVSGLVDVVAVHSYLRIQHSGAGAGYILPTLAMPVEQRGLRVVGARLRYLVSTAFDGTLTTFNWTLYHVDGQTVATDIGSVALVNTVGDEVTAVISPFTAVLMGEGSSLVARVNLDRSADGTVGEMALLSIEIQFEEGHA